MILETQIYMLDQIQTSMFRKLGDLLEFKNKTQLQENQKMGLIERPQMSKTRMQDGSYQNHQGNQEVNKNKI